MGRGRLRRPRPVPCAHFPSCQGDASVPSPHNPSPAPTGTKALPRRHHNIPTLERESATPAPTGTKELPKRHDKIPTRESSPPPPRIALPHINEPPSLPLAPMLW